MGSLCTDGAGRCDTMYWARVGERGCTKVVEEKEVTDRSQEGYSSVKGRVRDRDRDRERERENHKQSEGLKEDT